MQMGNLWRSPPGAAILQHPAAWQSQFVSAADEPQSVLYIAPVLDVLGKPSQC